MNSPEGGGGMHDAWNIRRIALAAWLIAAVLSGGCGPSEAASQPSYAEDRAAIEDLMARYLFAMDWNDFEAYTATFTEDGELEFARGTARGREAIGDTARSFKKAIGEIYRDDQGRPATLRHVLGHTVIRIEGDRAWARAFWYEMANTGPDGAPEIGTFGHYEDELARIDGQWLFKRRRILNEFLDGRRSGPENPVRRMDEQARPAE